MDTAGFALAFLLGLGILYVGAEGTIHGAVAIARRMGVSSLLIGLTLVAYGTSAPELAIDLTAAVSEKTDLAFGDLVGSNLANLGLILGVAAVIRSVSLDSGLVRFEIPMLLLQAILLWWLCSDGMLSRADGLLLLAMFVVIAFWTVRRGLGESKKFKAQMVDAAVAFESSDPLAQLAVVSTSIGESDQQKEGMGHGPPQPISATKGIPSHDVGSSDRSYILNLAMVLFGLFGLIAVAQLMVYGAVNFARGLGVSELAIGLTIVAIGTSLPELATAILASRKGESDIVIGNVAGSNLFNISFILGLVAWICPIPIRESTLRFELPVLVAFTAFLLPLAFFHRCVRRWAGILYLIVFAFFMIGQFVASQ